MKMQFRRSVASAPLCVVQFPHAPADASANLTLGACGCMCVSPTMQTKLTTLGLGHNCISVVEGLENQGLLEDLWLNGNRVESYEALAGLAHTTSLETLYLEHNPIAQDFQYRMRVPQACASLTQLDATTINRGVR